MLSIVSFFIISEALFSCRGFVFRREFALLTFSDESFGRLAFHRISFIVMGLIRFLFRLKVSASFRANSCLLTLVAPAVCVVPVIFLSAISRSIAAKFVFSVGETCWSVRTLTSFPCLRLFIIHVAKFCLCFGPQP